MADGNMGKTGQKGADSGGQVKNFHLPELDSDEENSTLRDLMRELKRDRRHDLVVVVTVIVVCAVAWWLFFWS